MENQTQHSKPSEKPLEDRIDELMAETLKRYPGQGLMLAEAVPLYRQDWIEVAKEKGWGRFADAVIKARRESEFFPSMKQILERLPEPPPKHSDAVLAEIRELEQQRKAGRKFYGLADLAQEFKKLAESKKVSE